MVLVEEISNEEAAKLLDESKHAEEEVEGNEKQKREIEIHLYVKGKGPRDVFKCQLVGWDSDRIDVLEIAEKYNLSTLYAFNPKTGRGARLRFNPRNGHSAFPYYPGTVVRLDSDPKESWLMPVSRMLLWLAFVAFSTAVVMKDPPEWLKKIGSLYAGRFPWPFLITIFVIVRLWKRSQNSRRISKYSADLQNMS